ncbi:MAG: hypothetical protein IJK77_09345 [Lachnospiraceae bacterium]|nr:hypothetical protein [Lachnospiraceae bacterium]
MKRTNKYGKTLLMSVLAAAVLISLCTCGRKTESTAEPSTDQTAAPAESTAMQPSAQESSFAHSTPVESPSGSEDAPEEDPWAEGYYYDEALTDALWERFATADTNDAGSDPGCTMTQDFLEELDRRAHAWLYDGISDRDTENAMLALTFRFPNDPPETARDLKSVKAGVYSFNGTDPDGLAARIRLGNTEACFYLFLRAYYSPADGRTRIYMINGLVW